MKTEIAQRLRELGAESAEERRLAEKRARQEEALDYYREHGKAPHRNTALGRAWNGWMTTGRSSDPEFKKRARALGWLSKKERTAAIQEEALDYYRKYGKRPSGVLGQFWCQWVCKTALAYSPDFVKRARAIGWCPGRWPTRSERA